MGLDVLKVAFSCYIFYIVEVWQTDFQRYLEAEKSQGILPTGTRYRTQVSQESRLYAKIGPSMAEDANLKKPKPTNQKPNQQKQ